MEEDCPICLEPIHENSLFTTSCCNNHFHKICHFKCINIKNECPLCRHKYDHIIINISEQPHNTLVDLSKITRFALFCFSIGILYPIYIYLFKNKS